MIRLNAREAQLTASVIWEALGIAIAPDDIRGLEVHDTGVETVVITSATSLHAIGKSYFRQLVEGHKRVGAK